MQEATGTRPRAPKRIEKFHIDLGEVADESEASFAFVNLHRLREEAGGVTRADAHGGLARERDRTGELLVEQAGEHHDGGIARFAVGDAEAVLEAAGDPHARQRRGENLAAAMDYQNVVARVRDFGDLAGNRLHVFFIFEERPCNFNH